MRELGGGKMLLEFVCELPALKAMEEDKGKGGFLALSTSGSPTDITEELNTVVKKLVTIHLIARLSPIFEILCVYSYVGMFWVWVLCVYRVCRKLRLSLVGAILKSICG
jgi:hypothetical protein